MLRLELKSLPKGILTLLEASHDHLLKTPLSNFTPQREKVRFSSQLVMAKIYDRNFI